MYPVRLARLVLLTFGLTLVFWLPAPLTHIPIGLFAPIGASLIAGRLLRATRTEALGLALVVGAVIAVPAPIAHQYLEFLPRLRDWVVVFFSLFVAFYYMLLTGLAAWFGGYLKRQEEREDAAQRGISGNGSKEARITAPHLHYKPSANGHGVSENEPRTGDGARRTG